MAFITRIDTSTLSNQNISSALLLHTYTNTTRVRKLFVTVDLDQIAGNGDYVAYLTVQRAGSGSAFEINPRTTATVASGITSISLHTIAIIVEATDVLKVYVKGLAGDTTTPDSVTKVFEELPALAGDQMDLVNAPNATAVTAIQNGVATAAALATVDGIVDDILVDTSTTLDGKLNTIDDFLDTEVAAILEDTGTTLPAQIGALNNLSAAQVDTQLSATHGVGLWGAAAGSGATEFVYTLTSSADASPIAGASVWVTTDEAGENVIASGTTDQYGQVTFYLDNGTVYVWRRKTGWNFTNPDTEAVS